MFRIKDTCLFITIIIVLSGCFSKSPEYPVDWPALTQKTNIESEITGSFACHGSEVRIEPKLDKQYPLQSFFVFDEPNLWCNRVEIHRVEDGLEFRYMINTAMVKKQKYLRGQDYTIKNGWIEIEPVSDWFTKGIVDARTSVKRYLTINKVGDLVVKVQTSTVELVFYIPAVGTSDLFWVTSKRLIVGN